MGFGYIVAQSFILGALLSLAFVFLPQLLRDTIAFFGSTFYIISATIMLLNIRGVWRRAGAVALGVFGLMLFIMILIGMGEIWVLEPPAA
ncbi:hypothetical protein FNJ84_06200 [Paracoccus sp. M683]|uniref:hypothetical protein n=1 Tax=Paracoccus sp. M683 TaxID=2594268 RepID=UPI0011801BBB|nr:hypothetical protein [Paracoccus sp. M683]TRW98366.1 hypothetical protein FNJ84_06200 [Paracoccus sp. M683]